ncbi:hypothetical protein PIB30_048847 [Stylosanthes scabra]|uniref:Uncharacterized protein n=1 Tax=Stylosanthes scabra TaxID=79078 RepID=A0ABU6VHA0_9FABA|nr:hypothetical protein [Stylosanthes scabra]
MVWLRERLQHIPSDADADTLRQYARCYILLFFGGYLMPDKLGNMVALECGAQEDYEHSRMCPAYPFKDLSPVSRVVPTHIGLLSHCFTKESVSIAAISYKLCP